MDYLAAFISHSRPCEVPYFLIKQQGQFILTTAIPGAGFNQDQVKGGWEAGSVAFALDLAGVSYSLFFQCHLNLSINLSQPESLPIMLTTPFMIRIKKAGLMVENSFSPSRGTR